MADQSSAEQPVAASASSPSVPPASAVDPSPGVRITQHIREALTDLGGFAAAVYLARHGAITGAQALYFMIALALPSPLLLRLAKIVSGRGSSSGAGVAVALLGASAAWAHARLYAVAGVAAISVAACLGGCAAGAPQLSPITPHIIQRAEYGTCIESGGKLEVPNGPTFAMITQACMLMDAGAAVVADASAPVEETDDASAPDAIKPGSIALVLPDFWRGQCTVPVFVQGAKTLADLDPVRCAVTAPGDRITVFRRGQRWVTLR